VTVERILLLAFVLSMFLLAYLQEPVGWIFISVMLGIFVGQKIEKSTDVQSAIPDSRLRGTIVFVLILTLACSFGIGKSDAMSVIRGKGIKRVSTKIIKEHKSEVFVARQLLDRDETLKFLGVAGDYFFFLREDNTAVYVLKYDDLFFLELWR
jgi:hypothetical protein